MLHQATTSNSTLATHYSKLVKYFKFSNIAMRCFYLFGESFGNVVVYIFFFKCVNKKKYKNIYNII